MDWTAIKARIENLQGAFANPEDNAEREQQILQRRAALLERRVVETHRSASEEGLLVVRIASGRYAFALTDVVEVVSAPRIIAVPGAPRVVSGVIQLRGAIVPVFSLEVLLGSTTVEPRSADALAVMVRDGGGTAGVLVEAVEGTRTGNRPDRTQDDVADPAVWRTEDLVTVLDTAQLMNRKPQR